MSEISSMSDNIKVAAEAHVRYWQEQLKHDLEDLRWVTENFPAEDMICRAQKAVQRSRMMVKGWSSLITRSV